MLGKQRMMRDVRISRTSLVREVQLSRKRFVPFDMGGNGTELMIACRFNEEIYIPTWTD